VRDRLLPGPPDVGIVVVAVLRGFVSQDAGISAATAGHFHLPGAKVILLRAVGHVKVPSGTRRALPGFGLALFGACLPACFFPNVRDRLLPGPPDDGVVDVLFVQAHGLTQIRESR